MANNLDVGTMITGTANMTNNSILEKYWYNNDAANCTTYGALYQWDEMMQYVTTEGTQGVCPTGFHLPTDDEWKTLEMHLGMSQAQVDAAGYREVQTKAVSLLVTNPFGQMEILTKTQLSATVDSRRSLGAAAIPRVRSAVSPTAPTSGRPVS